MRTRVAAIFFGVVFSGLIASAKTNDENVKILDDVEKRLKAIYQRGEYDFAEFRGQWLRDSAGYLVLENSGTDGVAEIVRYDTESGKRLVLLGQRKLVSAQTGRMLIKRFVQSPTNEQFLLEANTPDQDESQRGYWLFDSKSGGLKKVNADIAWLHWVDTFSPNGTRIVYSQNADLHAFDFTKNRSIQLTHDGVVDTIENGEHARWSPDGKRLAYVQSDRQKVPMRAMVLPTDPTYPQVAMRHFARVGMPIPTLRVGVVDAEGGRTRWLELPRPAGTFYIETMHWAGNSDELLLELRSRGRDAREFLIVDTNTGNTETVYSETDRAWVDASSARNAGLEWIQAGKAFVLLSEKDGWRHAYVISRDGKTQSLLTHGDSDIIQRGTVDEHNGWFYYFASPDNATQRYLYRISLDGKGMPERVTPADQPGTHRYEFSPDRKWAIHSYSNFDTPPVFDLVRLADHHSLRVLESNDECRQKVKPLIHRPTEFLKLDIGGGIELDAYMIKPRDFDSSKKYPVFVYVYSEPHAQTVLDDWVYSRNHTMFHRMIADLGYLVVSMDSRGTPAPKGAAWRRAIFGSLGPLSTQEQAKGLAELARTRPCCDTSRVGIWGWSGGGSNTLNAMFRKPDVYHVGIAVAPKPQPNLYNAWFQEIFMRTPEENPEGYRQSAPINFAEGLRGDLLIVHGTGETNTHLQITEGLVDKLITLGKRFDYMTYPNRDHGLREGEGTRVHLRMLMTRYLIEHLPRGPR